VASPNNDVTLGRIARMAEESSHEEKDIGQKDGLIRKHIEPPKLPLLDRLSEFRGKADFSNMVLVGIQHLLANTAPLMVKLEQAGLDYKRMFLLGKVYSCNPLSAEAL
jgi:hypothetical protein